jgi:hypothetical protein
VLSFYFDLKALFLKVKVKCVSEHLGDGRVKIPWDSNLIFL